jgi:hypothetical protein
MLQLDNQSVAPYNPKLLMKYHAHINIEYCNESNCIKYLFKYITKGVDRVIASLQPDHDERVDNIKHTIIVGIYLLLNLYRGYLPLIFIILFVKIHQI